MLDRLISSVYQKDKAAIISLIRSGTDINEGDEDGRTALMHAVLAEEADTKFVEFLLSIGADVNAHDRDQEWTAMHFAARDQRFELVKVLVDNGASVDPCDTFGNTPLWRCVMNASPDVAIISLLLKNGANPEKKNKRGVSTIDVAENIGNRECLKVLDGYINK